MWSARAAAEALTLLVADNKAGYFGVSLCNPGYPKPYKAQVWRGGKMVSLGSFTTAEEAALCVARSPEGQAAAKRAAASVEGQRRAIAMPSGAVLKWAWPCSAHNPPKQTSLLQTTKLLTQGLYRSRTGQRGRG